jgi:hypothetical protein
VEERLLASKKVQKALKANNNRTLRRTRMCRRE